MWGRMLYQGIRYFSPPTHRHTPTSPPQCLPHCWPYYSIQPSRGILHIGESPFSVLWQRSSSLDQSNIHFGKTSLYTSFCNLYGLPYLPITQHKCSLFITFLSLSGLQASSIDAYLAAIRHLQVEIGEHRAEWPQLQNVLRHIKRSQSPATKRVRLPITAKVMLILYTTLFAAAGTPSGPSDHFDKVMIWAACCVGYFGFMRSGEFTACRANQGSPILVSDVIVDSHTAPSTIRLFLRKAKTDLFGKDVHIYLGKTDSWSVR